MFRKKILLVILIGIIFSVVNIYAGDGFLGTDANSIEEVCGLDENPGEVQYGGVHLPEEGTIRALVLFIQFPDDQLESTNWPKDQMPTYANHYIDSEVLPVPTPKSITDYFHVMSNGRLHLIGDIYPDVITTEHTRKWYIKNFDNLNYSRQDRFGYINREVLVSIDDEVDYLLYDTWGKENGVFINDPDGKVEMIIMVYRNHARDYRVDEWVEIEEALGLNFWGTALLGYANSNTVDIVTDGTTIDMSGFPGSGLMYKNGFFHESYWGGNYGFKLGLLAHEFGHYLWGGIHPTIENLGIMGGTGLAPNSVERERMGWLQFTDIIEPNISIPDFVTQNTALRIPLNGTEEYFAIENRQQLSMYDDMHDRTGIYITHVTGASSSNMGIMDLECADGEQLWFISELIQNPYNTACDMMAIWTNNGPYPPPQIGPHGYGKDERDYIRASDPCTNGYKNYYKVFDIINDQLVLTEEHSGDVEDAFNMEYNQVFSTWSNPTTYKADNTTSDKALEIVSYNSGNNSFNLKYYDGNPEDASPSKPQFLQLSNLDSHPHLTWIGNIEPDLATYKVYKKIGSDEFVLVSTRAWDVNSFYDTNTTIVTGYPVANETIAQYKITAIDNQSKESTYSNIVKARVAGMPDEKSLSLDPRNPYTSSLKTIPNEYAVSQNFPNPFNPTTTISFDLPQESFVKLFIYDINGRKVVTLVNEQLSEGSYNAKFDAANFPSGIYIYKITAGSFSQIKRMLLIK